LDAGPAYVFAGRLIGWKQGSSSHSFLAKCSCRPRGGPRPDKYCTNSNHKAQNDKLLQQTQTLLVGRLGVCGGCAWLLELGRCRLLRFVGERDIQLVPLDGRKSGSRQAFNNRKVKYQRIQNAMGELREAAAHLQLPANTFVRHLQLAALCNLDRLCGLVTRLLVDILDLIDDFVTLEDLAEDDVAAIEPRGDGSRDEELATVGVLARVGHGEDALLAVLELEVLVGELGAVDGLAASACRC
jgi:hypothetical protein